jgi:fused signal recognition particle receptor
MGLFGKLVAKLSRSSITPLDWDEARKELLASDLGPTLVDQVITSAKKLRAEDAQSGLTSILTEILSTRSREISYQSPLSVFLIVGINGTGKTTSAAKLANALQKSQRSVALAAADTFRAAAVDQLQTWGTRIGVDVITGKDQSEPASVAFDAATYAKENNREVLIVDTAGRLHNKSDLMNELGKVKRVVEKVAPVTEVLLVIDATTGQNAMTQAKVFSEAVDVTGLIVTKMDGSAKGGIALAIEAELGIPIKFIGTGESIEDFAPFEPQLYIQSLLEA